MICDGYGYVRESGRFSLSDYPILPGIPQKFLVPHILLMDNRMLKMFLVSGKVFFSHFLSIKYVDFCILWINVFRTLCLSKVHIL